MVELKDRAPWVWETRTICNNITELDSFYAVPENFNKLWMPSSVAPRISVTVPRMLAQPLLCVVFCAQDQRTPYELAIHIQGLLGKGHLDPTKYEVMLDWCCMAAHPAGGTGDTARTSLLAFPIMSIIGSTALHKWASTRLNATLGQPTAQQTMGAAQGTLPVAAMGKISARATPSLSVDVALIAQVTAAVLAAL